MLKDAPQHAESYLRDRSALGRFGTEDEVNSIVIFLASDHASFFHGAIIQADGGQSRHYMYTSFLDS
jgi:3-oxoacyl-[acyl-carrier protein] reductase